MPFRSIFIAIFAGTSLILAAVIFHGARPESDLAHGSAEFVRATGKCGVGA